MEEYGEDLAPIRYSFRSLVVLDDFKTGKPLSTAVGEYFYVSAQKSTTIVKLPMAKQSEDRIEDGERLTVEKPIEQLAAFYNEICYVSDGSVYTLASKLLLKADALHILELPVRVGRRVLTALCSTGGKFYAVDDAAAIEELTATGGYPCSLGDFLSVCAGVLDDRLVLILGVANGRFGVFSVRGLAELTELGTFAAEGACLGLLGGKALCLWENALKLVDPLSGAVVASCADEVFSASIFPLLPRPGCEQYVAINTSEIYILDYNLRQAQVIELARFAAPACIYIPEIGRNFEPDAITVCRHVASALYEPRLKSDIFRPIDCAIKGCKTAATGGQEPAPGLEIFTRNDYCYIQLTAGFEMNVVALHYASIADVNRSDGKSFKFGLGSTAERASERSEFCADCESLVASGAGGTKASADYGGQPGVQPSVYAKPALQVSAFAFYSQPNTSAALKYAAWPVAPSLSSWQGTQAVNYAYPMLNYVERDVTPVKSAQDAVAGLPSERMAESGVKAQNAGISEGNAPTGAAMQASAADQRQAHNIPGAYDEQTLRNEAEAQSAKVSAAEYIAFPVNSSKAELDTTKKYFNSLVCILNALAPEAPRAEIAYDYGYGFDIHIAGHCKKAHRLLTEQLFKETAPFFDTAQYNLHYCNAPILKSSELQRLGQATRYLLRLCYSQYMLQQNDQQAGQLSADDLEYSGEGQLCRFLRVGQEFKHVRLEQIAHIAKSLQKRLK